MTEVCTATAFDWKFWIPESSDRRLRGNDGVWAATTFDWKFWIPACARMTEVWGRYRVRLEILDSESSDRRLRGNYEGLGRHRVRLDILDPRVREDDGGLGK